MKAISFFYSLALLCSIGGSAWADSTSPESSILFEEKFDQADAAKFTLQGKAKLIDFGKLEGETTGQCVQLDSSAKEPGERSGSVKMAVHGLAGSEGKWFRFSFRGLPAKDFRVSGEEDLEMRVRFFQGTNALDGVVKPLYSDIQRDRQDIDRNGDLARYGSAVWTVYAFDFRLPFNSIDTVELSVSFRNGEGQAPYGSFFVDEAKLECIDGPAVTTAKTAATPIDPKLLQPIGGRWYYLKDRSGTNPEAPRHFDSTNLDRLVYKAGDTLETPFAASRGAWLRKGFKDMDGKVATDDAWLKNTVEVDFDQSTMIVHSMDIPNHPTGAFPGYLGNPSYIQEQNVVAYLPLEPRQNPKALAMAEKNTNRALPMGPTGIAVNGVVFFNPFDAQMTEAVNIMDRCCGHPNQDNQYHYHKYPVCSRSPFEDKGEEHSPLIGWAFDGFPIYGPYEGKGEMAMNSTTNPLNAFNIHYDEARGWHYHVTPGKFPYLIGGYWGATDPRNFHPPIHPRQAAYGPQAAGNK